MTEKITPSTANQETGTLDGSTAPDTYEESINRAHAMALGMDSDMLLLKDRKEELSRIEAELKERGYSGYRTLKDALKGGTEGRFILHDSQLEGLESSRVAQEKAVERSQHLVRRAGEVAAKQYDNEQERPDPITDGFEGFDDYSDDDFLQKTE